MGRKGPLGAVEGRKGPLGAVEGRKGQLGAMEGRKGPLGTVEGRKGPLGGVEDRKGPLGAVEGRKGPDMMLLKKSCTRVWRKGSQLALHFRGSKRRECRLLYTGRTQTPLRPMQRSLP